MIDVGLHRWSSRSIAGWIALALVAAAIAGCAAAIAEAAAAVVWVVVAVALAGIADQRMRSVRSALVARERRGIAWLPIAATAVTAVLLVARAFGAPWPALEQFTVGTSAADLVWIIAFLITGLLICARWLHPVWAITIPLIAALLLGASVLLLSPSWPDGLAWWLGITLWANVLWVAPQVFKFSLSGEAENDSLLPLRPA